MLAELVDHVVGVDPDRDWITLAVLDAPQRRRRRRGPLPGDQRTATTRPSTFVDGHSVDSRAGLGDRGLSRLRAWPRRCARATRRVGHRVRPADPQDQRRRQVRRPRRRPCRPRDARPQAAQHPSSPRRVREAIRVHAVTRAAAVRARTGAINELKAHDRHRRRIAARRAARAAHRRLRSQHARSSATVPAPRSIERATRSAMRSLARRIQLLDTEVDDHDRALKRAARPGRTTADRRARHRLRHRRRSSTSPGPIPAAATAKPPSPASAAPHRSPATSGQNQTRHRLNRGGDRQLNRALYLVAVTKQRCDPATRAYIARRVAEGKTEREAIRCIKRFLARRVWRLLEHPPITT